jgi:hypothetical protein
MFSMSWQVSESFPSPCRAHPPQNVSGTRIALSHSNPVRAQVQVAGCHNRSRSRSHHTSRYNNSHSACLSRQRRAALVAAAAARRSSTSYTPRMHPRCSPSKHHRTSCPTHRRHSKASRIRPYQHTATSSHASLVTCSNRRPRRGSRHIRLKRTRTVISNSNSSTSTRRRRSMGRILPQVTRGRHTGRHQARKHTRRSSRRRSRNSRWDQDMDMGRMGTWTYGTRCRLATSAYSFHFILALAPHVSSEIG